MIKTITYNLPDLSDIPFRKTSNNTGEIPIVSVINPQNN